MIKAKCIECGILVECKSLYQKSAFRRCKICKIRHAREALNNKRKNDPFLRVVHVVRIHKFNPRLIDSYIL